VVDCGSVEYTCVVSYRECTNFPHERGVTFNPPSEHPSHLLQSVRLSSLPLRSMVMMVVVSSYVLSQMLSPSLHQPRLRQEWMTAIECVSASGVAIPPLLIFKAKHTNNGWIPAQAPPDWRFSTSNTGWTSDSHGYKWLTTVFAPSTQPEDPLAQRLLIMDGHSSHITANVIAFCMRNAVDMLILPPHTSHMLQPLDVGVFAPLKRTLASELTRLSGSMQIACRGYSGWECICAQGNELSQAITYRAGGEVQVWCASEPDDCS
jgi:hypothetical protein